MHTKQSKKGVIYISDILAKKHPNFHQKLLSILDKHQVKYSIIANCKDIWLRDFFPTLTSKGWVSFKYSPDYLKKYPKERTEIKNLELPIDYMSCELVVDGGNIVMSPNLKTALLCDKVLVENPHLSREDIINELERALNAKVILLPFHEDDTVGHEDGYVRWVDNERILIAENSLEDDQMHHLKNALGDYKLEYLCNYFTDKENKDGIPSAEGCYINFLETDGLVLVPQFGHEMDAIALEQLKALFPHKVVDGIDCRDICVDGGVLNCITAG